jgi:hypothetical protein
MTRRKGILGTTIIKRNILLTFWDKKKRDFLLRLRDGGSNLLIHFPPRKNSFTHTDTHIF